MQNTKYSETLSFITYMEQRFSLYEAQYQLWGERRGQMLYDKYYRFCKLYTAKAAPIYLLDELTNTEYVKLIKRATYCFDGRRRVYDNEHYEPKSSAIV